jgi:ABC-type transporter Mla subunit MlaD
MAANDLTPQLRTRLSRLETLVGWFVTIAVLLMLAGLAYYVRTLAKNKGWGMNKAPYHTYLQSAGGIKVGDKVMLMGQEVGEIRAIKPMPPGFGDNIYVEFIVIDDKIGYIWDDSVVNVRSSGLFGRYLELTKGGTRVTNNVFATYREKNGRLAEVFSRETQSFTNWTKDSKPFWLPSIEPPEIGTQIDETVAMLKVSLTNILQLTNVLSRTLNNAAEATDNANQLLRDARPLVRNITTISENLKEPRGALGEWLLPIAMNYQITALLTNANSTVSNVNDTVLNANSAVTNANTNLVVMFAEITQTLENLSGITGNLKAQVDRNNNIVSEISKLIIDTDDMVQGLKRHWLLRSAFKDQQKRETAPRPASKESGR